MKLNIKRNTLILLIILMFTFLAMLFSFNNIKVNADTIKEDGTYYYNQLNENSKKFYNAFVKMENEGLFKTSSSFDLIQNNIVTVDQVKACNSGDKQLLKDFGAGRDAYFLDNPKVFYVDFDKISISLKTQGNDYIALIDAGRDSSYLVNGINTSEVDLFINTFNEKVNQLILLLNDVNDTKEKIILANKLICENVIYSFEADGTNKQKEQIRTSYGALVNGYAVCEGYARSFKVLMDSQNIECLEVIGNVYNSEGGLEPHAWNKVNLGNKWYLVDCTFNDGSLSFDEYLLLGSENSKEYLESNTISNSGFEIKYPKLASFNYGMEELNTVVSYDRSSEPYSQSIKYSYKNYNTAKEMMQNGLYLVARHEYFDKDNNYSGWTNYFAIYPYENKNVFEINQNTFSTQLFITTQASDEAGMYSSFNENLIIAKSDVIVNEIYNENAISPKVQTMTPNSTTVLDVENVYEVSITYDKNLKLVDDTKEIGIFVYNEKSKNLNNYVKIENARLVSNDTISFTFTPSKMYEHDNLNYKFILVNVVGVNDLTPHFASLTFARPFVVCSKVFNDGKLYINSYGTPTIIDSQDLSMTGFKDKNGNQIAENQRSQLVLVAKKPSNVDNTKMEENVNSILGKENIFNSATYEIDLHICGGLTQIPSGSYMKVAFGFPEGYGPEDEGVSFKVYHFKKDSSGNIDPSLTEELNCVVTEYGIVVMVNSFSPFMIVAVKDTEQTTKNIYLSKLNNFGFINAVINRNNTDINVNEFATLIEGDSITYQINTNADYQVDFVLLNNKILKNNDNTFTINYDDLKTNNEIKVSFVSNKIALEEENNNVTSLNKTILSASNLDNGSDNSDNINNGNDNNNSDNNKNNEDLNNGNLILMICIPIGVIIIAGLAVLFVYLKKKKINS